MNQDFKDLMALPSTTTMLQSTVGWIRKVAQNAFIKKPRPGKFNKTRSLSH